MKTYNYDPSKSEKIATDLILREKTAWENRHLQVSNDVTFAMRDEIDKYRKNYFGIYEEPKDADTGLDKLWIPLTEWTVETIVKNIDLDTKDIQIKSPQAKDSKPAQLVRLITLHFMRLVGFGEFLNDLIRRLTIDGTAIAKCVKKWSPEHKRNLPYLSIVDPLNFILDPSARSLHDVPVMERAIMTIDEIERMDWDNKNLITYTEGSVPTATVYERWGLVPENIIPGRSGDKWVPATIIASASPETENQSPTTRELSDQLLVIHKIKADPNPFKPYEECWYKRVPNRWHGRPPAEMIKGLQSWINTVVNIRRDELMNKLAGKYKYRKGIGITRQMLESIKSGGAIPVDNMDDIMELNEKDVNASSYQEPAEIIGMAERVTGTHDVESLAPSLPATTAVLKDKGSRSAFSLTQENIGMFLERLMKRHFIPLVIDSLKQGEILRITGEPKDLMMLDDVMITDVFNKKVVNELIKKRKLPSMQDMAVFKDAIATDLDKNDKDRDVMILKEYFNVNYDVVVEWTDEKFDKAVMVRNLIDLIQARLPGMDGEALGREVAEIMGLSGSRFSVNPQAQREAQMAETRAEQPTARTEFQRGNIEGTLSPMEKPKTRGVPSVAAQQ